MIKKTETSKKVILTFDYELFLGNISGSVEKCLLEPTDKVIRILKETSSKAVFFVDSLFLYKLKKHDIYSYNKIQNQLLEILEIGSEIGLHIHPQWIDANYDDAVGGWKFNSSEFFIINQLDSKNLKNIIKKSVEELYLITKKYDEKYRIQSFRAGGWSIQPFFVLKDELFTEYGLKYDSSVVPKTSRYQIPFHNYDYRKASSEKDMWNFTNDVLEEEENGRFTEFPVHSIKINIIHIIANKFMLRNDKIFGDGKPNTKNTKTDIYKKIMTTSYRGFSVDRMAPFFFRKELASTIKSIITIVSHPKMISKYSLINIEFICKNYLTATFIGCISI